MTVPDEPEPTDVQARLEWFITSAPLYRSIKVATTWPKETQAQCFLPDEITRPCPRCGVDGAIWRRSGGDYGTVGQLSVLPYQCRNCGKGRFSVYYLWVCDYEKKESHFYKAGQHPKPDINPPKDLAKALGSHLGFYRQGMTLRHHNFGLGALVYFRRIIEEVTVELLDLLEAAIQENSSPPEALAVVEEARKAQRFEDKLNVASNAVPPHLIMHGSNPLGLLYKLLSYGIHARSDEEAMRIVDEMDQVLSYLFVELKAHRARRQDYSDGLLCTGASRFS